MARPLVLLIFIMAVTVQALAIGPVAKSQFKFQTPKVASKSKKSRYQREPINVDALVRKDEDPEYYEYLHQQKLEAEKQKRAALDYAKQRALEEKNHEGTRQEYVRSQSQRKQDPAKLLREYRADRSEKRNFYVAQERARRQYVVEQHKMTEQMIALREQRRANRAIATEK